MTEIYPDVKDFKYSDKLFMTFRTTKNISFKILLEILSQKCSCSLLAALAFKNDLSTLEGLASFRSKSISVRFK